MRISPARLAAFVAGLAIGASALAGEVRYVSVLQLIATPERYNGEQVRLTGFLHLEFEGDAIYLHRDDFDRAITPNSLAIDLSDAQQRAWSRLNNRYVSIEGRFSSTEKGHLGIRPGTIGQITRLGDWTVRRTVNTRSATNKAQSGLRALHDRALINSR